MVEKFRLPIETIEKSKRIEDNIITDIELSENDTNTSLYKYLFKYSNEYGKNHAMCHPRAVAMQIFSLSRECARWHVTYPWPSRVANLSGT